MTESSAPGSTAKTVRGTADENDVQFCPYKMSKRDGFFIIRIPINLRVSISGRSHGFL